MYQTYRRRPVPVCGCVSQSPAERLCAGCHVSSHKLFICQAFWFLSGLQNYIFLHNTACFQKHYLLIVCYKEDIC